MTPLDVHSPILGRSFPYTLQNPQRAVGAQIPRVPWSLIATTQKLLAVTMLLEQATFLTAGLPPLAAAWPTTTSGPCDAQRLGLRVEGLRESKVYVALGFRVYAVGALGLKGYRSLEFRISLGAQPYKSVSANPQH